jgi:hypothetical protein
VPLGDVVRARLQQFSAMNKFKKKAMRVIAEHLSVEEVEVIRDMFALMDTDKDGRVTLEELKAGLRKVGSKLAEPEMELLMEAVSMTLLDLIVQLDTGLEDFNLKAHNSKSIPGRRERQRVPGLRRVRGHHHPPAAALQRRPPPQGVSLLRQG